MIQFLIVIVLIIWTTRTYTFYCMSLYRQATSSSVKSVKGVIYLSDFTWEHTKPKGTMSMLKQ